MINNYKLNVINVVKFEILNINILILQASKTFIALNSFSIPLIESFHILEKYCIFKMMFNKVLNIINSTNLNQEISELEETFKWMIISKIQNEIMVLNSLNEDKKNEKLAFEQLLYKLTKI